jgi:phosphoribosylformylglycinamidine synthase
MVLAVPPENLADLRELCETYHVELTDIGFFTGSGRLVVRHAGRVVVDLAADFLHAGLPQRRLEAHIVPVVSQMAASPAVASPARMLLQLLAQPNIASKAAVIRRYDHEVQGGTVVKPLTGAAMDGPSDACVLRPCDSLGQTGIVVANGINPEFGKLDAYRMAAAVLDEAVRNAVACGADPEHIAVLDNFCWGDPLRPDTLGTLVEAARGCHDAARLMSTPFISGKDSLNNEYIGSDGARHAIPPTLLISSLGILEDLSAAVTMDLKETGNLLFLVGSFQPVFGGSHFDLVRGLASNEPVPVLDPLTPQVYRALHRAMRNGLVRSAHDLSEGGLAVAAAEMCIAGRLGLALELGTREPVRRLFGETNGCLLVEVTPQGQAAFQALFSDLPAQPLGTVVQQATLSIESGGKSQLSVSLDELVSAWNTPVH